MLGLGEPGREEHLLDGDVPVENVVVRMPDRPHAAPADPREQTVATAQQRVLPQWHS